MSYPTSKVIFNSVKGVLGLFGGTNKARRVDSEDLETVLMPEFESTMDDNDIRKLTSQWIDTDATYSTQIRQQQKDNINYWKGNQYGELQSSGTNRKPLVDNLLFEAIETFLPIATRGNPEANVYGDGTEDGEKIARTVTKALAYQANRQKLRMKLKGITRNWSLYMIGAVKVNWNAVENDIDTLVIIPSRLILDPYATVDVGGFYKGKYIGEKMPVTAGDLINMFPKKEKEISEIVQAELGTMVYPIQWTTRTDVFFTLEEVVLGKYKNPNWNYNGKTKIIDPVTKEATGEEEEIQGINHFSQPEFPYLFLTIFNLGKRPHDETSLITQNISLQDVVNKRYQQIDRNVDDQNNGIVLSGKNFTKEQAAQAAEELRKGGALWVPDGEINGSYVRDAAPQLSGNIFQHLNDAREEIRNIFGTSGSTPQGVEDQKSVRGKILINQLDSSRIGGGVTEYIEQLSSGLYNWYLQMMYVWYTEEHTFSILGPKAQELLTIKNTDFKMRLHVMVKDGSLIPKDPLTKRNEAIDLWSANAIDPISFYTALDYPNPYDAAKQLLIWQMIQKGGLPPTVMFPDLPVPGQPAQAGGAPGANPGPAITPGQTQAGIQAPPPGGPVSTTGQQLLNSVPIK